MLSEKDVPKPIVTLDAISAGDIGVSDVLPAELHESSVKRIYREAWQQCEMKSELLPQAKAVQNFVPIWKYLMEAMVR